MANKKKATTPPVEETADPSWEQVAVPLPEAGSESDWNASATEEEPSTEDWAAVPPAVHAEVFIREHAGEFNPEICKSLFYGESGSGKTRLGSTYPEVLFLDIDKGMASVTEHVDAADIDTFRQMQDAYAFLKGGSHSYTSVVIDTVNEMQRLAMGATIEDFPQIRRSYDNLPSQSDYGKMLHDWIELTRDFILLPMRVVLLAQVNTRQFDTDVLMPQLIGKNSAREVARKMDVIGHIYKSEKEDTATGKKISEVCFDAPEYVTKDRSFRLPAILPTPTYDRIASFWK